MPDSFEVKSLCSKCGVNESRQGQRYCNECHADYMREHRPTHSELAEEQRKRANARSYLNVYVKRGKVQKLPCEICGELKVEAHHDDYEEPLDVIWFCKKHRLVYRKLKAAI